MVIHQIVDLFIFSVPIILFQLSQFFMAMNVSESSSRREDIETSQSQNIDLAERMENSINTSVLTKQTLPSPIIFEQKQEEEAKLFLQKGVKSYMLKSLSNNKQNLVRFFMNNWLYFSVSKAHIDENENLANTRIGNPYSILQNLFIASNFSRKNTHIIERLLKKKNLVDINICLTSERKGVRQVKAIERMFRIKKFRIVLNHLKEWDL